jgi:hypothetical protein
VNIWSLNFLLILSYLLAITEGQSFNKYMTTFRGTYVFSVWMIDNVTVRFNVTVPNNNYFSVGFGKTMTNCDMVMWQANGEQSKTVDLWS